jgi:ABC-2 type transport system permease protein
MAFIQQILSIARNAFLEGIRRPVYGVLMIVGVLFLIGTTFMSAYTLKDDNQMLVEVGLSILWWSGLLFAAFTAAGVLNEEVENKTVLTVVSKPVSKPLFVFGKYLGVAAAILLAVYTLGLVFLMSMLHGVMQSAADPHHQPVLVFGFGALFLALGVAAAGNYMFNWNFASAFTMALAILGSLAYVFSLMMTHDWHFQPIATEFLDEKKQLGHVLIGILMVYQAVMILTAIAVACSTRLGLVLTLMICIGVSFLGLVAESLLGDFVQNPDMGAYTQPVGYILWGLAKTIYVILPNFQMLWPADSLLNQIWKETPTAEMMNHFLTISAYGFLQISAFLLLAIGLFQTRELG